MPLKSVFSKIPVLLAILLLAFSPYLSLAQTAADPGLSVAPPGETEAQRQARLTADLNSVNAEIAADQALLTSKQSEGVSIQRDVSILDLKIKQAQLTIKANQIILEQLSKDISGKTATIQTLAGQIDANKASLGDLVRKTDEFDQGSLTEFVLVDKKFSDFFGALDAYSQVKSALRDLYNQTAEAKTETEAQKKTLVDKQTAQAAAQAKIVKNKADIQADEASKKKLLALNKQQQSDYKALIADRQAKAAAIKAALFSLRDSAAIPFGTAYQYALIAQQKTGIRPAFLLAILTQETNLGKNVGTCNRSQDPPEKHYQQIMKPSRDIAPYLAITSALGLDPNTQPLSCPMAGGYGGAMGPAQFIPSTWVLLEDRITAATGHNPTDPWNPEDAFVASAFYLTDLGAANGGTAAEKTAALKYYAGAAWQKSANQFYGTQVLAKAASIQANMIDPINQVATN